MPIFRAFSLFYLGFGEWVKKGGEEEIGRFREILAKKITICLPQGKKVGKHNQKKERFMIKTAIIYDHRARTAEGEAGPLEVRVTINRKSYYINTGIKVLRREWRGNSIVNRLDSHELNERLCLITLKVEREINECIERSEPIDVAQIRRKVYQLLDVEKHGNTAVVDWIEEQMPKLGLALGTLKHYATLVKRMQEYGGFTTWQSVTVEQIYNFDHYLHQRTKPQAYTERMSGAEAKKIGDAGVYKYHKCLKAMLARAERIGKIDRSPYSKLHGEFKRGDNENIEYLTEDEMHAIESLRPLAGSIMAAVRDLFVFQMYTGMAYSDSQRFDINNYQLIDGKWVVVSERIKTGVPYVNQLLPPVVEVLERYGWNTPKIDNADYNHNLKSLGMAAGIVKPLHSHMARHTFATWALSHNVPIEIVSKMLGHTNITQTQRYAKVLPKAVKSEFDRLEEIMKK